MRLRLQGIEYSVSVRFYSINIEVAIIPLFYIKYSFKLLNVGERQTLGELFSVAKSETKGTVIFHKKLKGKIKK